MEAFLASASAPAAKRKASVTSGDNSGRQPKKGTTKTAERPRQDGNGLVTLAATATEAVTTDVIVATGPAPRVRPSFREAMTGQAAGPNWTRALCDKAEQLASDGRLEDALNTLTRALISCACQAPVRRQFKEAGASLGSIDPIGQCSCRDFVATAQTRRQRPASSSQMFPGLPAPSYGRYGESEDSGGTFPMSELDLTAVYRLATDGASCTCGSGRVRCMAPDHLDALDRLAAVANKLGRHTLASRAGQWYMELAPQNAQGYLHVAKAVLSLGTGGSGKKREKLSQKEPTPSRDARFVARCIYAHGRHNVRVYGDATGPLAKVLAQCCRQYNQGDFLPDLPIETAEAIFQQLSITDLLACLRVSKRWAAALRRVRLRIAKLELPGPPKGNRASSQKQLSLKALQRFLRQFPGLQPSHLRVYLRNNPGPNYASFVEGVLRHYQPYVDCLELSTWWEQESGPRSPEFSRLPQWSELASTAKLPCRCRKLTLIGVSKKNLADLRGPIGWAAASLESLTIDGTFQCAGIDFSLPRLRHLRAIGGLWSNKLRFALLPSICVAAPQLEQLYLDGVCFTDLAKAPTRVAQPGSGNGNGNEREENEDGIAPGETILPGYDPDTVFKSLHTLVVGEGCFISAIATHPIFPRLPPGMRCIDILNKQRSLVDLVLYGSQQALSPPKFKKLEAFRCLCAVERPERLFELLRPNLDDPDGRLAHLELDARDLGTAFQEGRPPYYHFPYPERLRTVGLHDFAWDESSLLTSLGNVARGNKFVDWVVQFRNVETISVYPAWQWEMHSEGAKRKMIMGMVQRMVQGANDGCNDGANGAGDAPRARLRTIYQGMLDGAPLSVVKQWLDSEYKDTPIELPRGHREFRPPIFPWPDREEQ